MKRLSKVKVRGPKLTFKQAADRIYRRLRGPWLAQNRACKPSLLLEDRARLVPSSDIHHLRGRHRTLLIDKRFFCPTSRKWHDWIDAHPDEARKYGFLCERGDWHREPGDAETERLTALIEAEMYAK